MAAVVSRLVPSTKVTLAITESASGEGKKTKEMRPPRDQPYEETEGGRSRRQRSGIARRRSPRTMRAKSPSRKASKRGLNHRANLFSPARIGPQTDAQMAGQHHEALDHARDEHGHDHQGNGPDDLSDLARHHEERQEGGDGGESRRHHRRKHFSCAEFTPPRPGRRPRRAGSRHAHRPRWRRPR